MFTETILLTKPIAAKLNPNSGTGETLIMPMATTTPLLDVGADSTLYSGAVIGRVINQINAVARISSLIEVLPPEVEELTELESAVEIRDWKFNSPRKQLDFYDNLGGTSYFRGTITLVRTDPYINQDITDVIWNIRENIPNNQTLTVRLVNAGYGLLSDTDEINILGSYTEIVQLTKKAVWLTVTSSPSPSPTPTPTPVPDTSPPTASLSVANMTSGSSSPYNFTVTYSDNVAVKVSTITSNNLRVVDSDTVELPVTLSNVNSSVDTTPVNATYAISPPGGTWDNFDNDTYTISIKATQVSDTSNNFIPASTLGTFTVNIPSPTPTPTPTPPTPTLQTEVQTYLTSLSNAGTTLDDFTIGKINDFVATMKSAGYWTLMSDIALLLGINLTSAGIKLKGTGSLNFVNLTNSDLSLEGIKGNSGGYIEFDNTLNANNNSGVSILTYVNSHSSSPVYFSAGLGDSAGIAQFGAYGILYLDIGGVASGGLTGGGNFWLVGGIGSSGTSKAFKNYTEVGSITPGVAWSTPNPNKYYFLGSPSQPKAPNTVTLGGLITFNSALSKAQIDEINIAWENLLVGVGRWLEY